MQKNAEKKKDFTNLFLTAYAFPSVDFKIEDQRSDKSIMLANTNVNA